MTPALGHGPRQEQARRYELLQLIRESGKEVPFFIFAGQNRPEFRREAAARGAQLSTNDMLELVDNVVKYLGEKR